MTSEKMLDISLNELKNIPSGTIFTFENLFKGYYWNSINIEIKKQASIMFYLKIINDYAKYKINTYDRFVLLIY
jgi:hypothetical protein